MINLSRLALTVYISISLSLSPILPILSLAQFNFSKTSEASSTNFLVNEGYDFATHVLHDPWDMSQFSDVSQWFNHAGSENYLLDVKVENGVFSARTGSGLSYFFLLYGGYGPGLREGKIGIVNPIPTNTFSCFYMAERAYTQAGDHYLFEWGDENMPPSVTGTAYRMELNPDDWQLSKIDLRNWPFVVNTPWTARPEWQALRVIPTLTANVDFSIDWARLTDCNPVNVTLNNIPSGTYSLWVGTGDPERRILIDWNFSPSSNGTYVTDVQGLAPGEYNYYLTPYQESEPVIQQGHITIVPDPVLDFSRPSRISGEDYATVNGNPWDFSDSADAPEIDCANNSLKDGVLYLDTLPPSMAPSNCIGTAVSESDPLVYLNTPKQILPGEYRYLSFRHSIDAEWAVPEQGMIVRWVWGVNRSGKICYNYSREAALDVGWQTYSVDLYDDWNGTPATVYPSSCQLIPWKDEPGKVFMFRFEPNENITSQIFHQEIDWIRLTKEDRVTQGYPFTIKLNLNIPDDQLKSIRFYYTTDPKEPIQNLAAAKVTNSSPLSAPFKVFLPISLTPAGDPFLANLNADIDFSWDTRGVSPGDYYICGVADNGLNQSTFCSGTPIKVLAP